MELRGRPALENLRCAAARARYTHGAPCLGSRTKENGGGRRFSAGSATREGGAREGLGRRAGVQRGGQPAGAPDAAGACDGGDRRPVRARVRRRRKLRRVARSLEGGRAAAARAHPGARARPQLRTAPGDPGGVPVRHGGRRRDTRRGSAESPRGDPEAPRQDRRRLRRRRGRPAEPAGFAPETARVGLGQPGHGQDHGPAPDRLRLHAARLLARRRARDQQLRRGVDLHSGAGAELRAAAHRDRGRARGRGGTGPPRIRSTGWCG